MIIGLSLFHVLYDCATVINVITVTSLPLPSFCSICVPFLFDVLRSDRVKPFSDPKCEK